MTTPAELAPVRVLRKEDLLDLTFSFRNLKIRRPLIGTPVLVRRDPASPAQLIATFPRQHVLEKAYFETAGAIKVEPPDPDVGTVAEPLEPPPVRSLLSGRTVLVFEVDATTEIPYTAKGLVAAMRLLPPRLVPVARGAAAAVLPQPKHNRTDRWASSLYAGAAAKNRHTADDIAATMRVLRNVTQLMPRFGPEVALAAAADADPEVFGALRAELTARAELAPAALENPLPADPSAVPSTALELPYRLLLSPSETAAWAHSEDVVTHPGNDRIELWHTRLGIRREHDDGTQEVDELDANGRTVRAVWTRDGDAATMPRPDPAAKDAIGRTPLSPYDRYSLVRLTGHERLAPVRVGNLALSTLGGWLDVLGQWEPPPGLDLEEWRHVATLGRDHYVRVLYAGYLFPFGHRASLVKVTERKFDPAKPGAPAYLYQRMFILVRQPVRTYEYRGGTPLPRTGAERLDVQFPFSSITLVTSVTPNLDDPNAGPPGLPGNQKLFFPHVGGQRFEFKAVGVDRDGRAVEFRTPLLFVSKTLNTPADLPAIVKAYNPNPGALAVEDPGHRAAAVAGQALAFAESKKPDDTRLDVSRLLWAAAVPDDLGSIVDGKDPALFLPKIDQATGVIPSVGQLTGEAEQVVVSYADGFKQHAFDAVANQGQVFLKLANDAKMEFSKQSDRVGALAAPDLSVAGLSRLTGPVAGDLAKLSAGEFNPADFFKAFNANIFGVIPLAELVKLAGLDKPLKVPTFLSQILNAVSMFTQDVERAVKTLQELRKTVPQIGTAVQDLADKSETLLTTVGEFLKPGSGTTIEAVQGAFDGFSASFTRLRQALPKGTDPAITGLLDRVDQQLKAWDDTGAQVVSIKQALVKAAQGAKLPDVATTRLEWSPDLQAWSPFEKNPDRKNALFWPHEGAGKMTMVVDLRGSLRPDVSSGADVTCTLEHFDILLVPKGFPGLRLEFERIRFTARAGKKPDIEVVFNGVDFEGPLQFVQTLRNLIPLDGFSDPPALQVTPSGITADYSMTLPAAAIGVFSLENLSLGASLRVPFIGESLEAGFHFCTRERPFTLTVSFLGGGGFFGITARPNGIKTLEAALEFGAAVSMNLGVASGSLSVMAGIYFRLENGTDAVIAGYLRARGEVDVLGIISASIELYMEFRYQSSPRAVYGRATITVEIDVLFFHKSVSITCERRFAGSDETFALAAAAGAQPTFAELMAPYTEPVTALRRDPALEYCTAFGGID
ncbi:hypothetical protein [Amycolatopsis sp. CA-230715]|uniref:hypothetical protein n=1 Tax=Amycolatopsis sp. CA-230715 TaxID=2745196 RepID=UPI001C00EA42|nr:hypothetical protein [Amycolatopsis sp. CA-230715]QWF84014.1 hypothetical protein HUW46_07458 [Amycolatopsis sp. CA-230715]